MNQSNKQVALVTGGARRIGAAIVRHLHENGFYVVIHCRSSLTEAHLLAEELNQKRVNSALVLQRDLLNNAAIDDLIADIKSWAARLDLLVNNASVFFRSDLPSFNAQQWQLLFDTNVRAPFLLSTAARPLLARHQGSIINISDIHAERPLKGYSAYCQTKAALDMQTQSLAREFAPDIRVNAVAPGAIAWPEQMNTLTPDEQEQIIASTPLKRHGEPQVIAQAVLALAQNSFITGQCLRVDGGRSIR